MEVGTEFYAAERVKGRAGCGNRTAMLKALERAETHHHGMKLGKPKWTHEQDEEGNWLHIATAEVTSIAAEDLT